MLGIQTRSHRIVGTDETTELRPSFSYFCLVISYTVSSRSVQDFTPYWIQTVDHWCPKWALCQLSHNDSLTSFSRQILSAKLILRYWGQANFHFSTPPPLILNLTIFSLKVQKMFFRKRKYDICNNEQSCSTHSQVKWGGGKDNFSKMEEPLQLSQGHQSLKDYRNIRKCRNVLSILYWKQNGWIKRFDYLYISRNYITVQMIRNRVGASIKCSSMRSINGPPPFTYVN